MCANGTPATMEVPAVRHLLNQATDAAVRELVIMETDVNTVNLKYVLYLNNVKI
jgi:hypothetical protein